MGNETPSYKAPMPARMGERGSASGAGYTRASITRPAIAAPREPNVKTGGMTLQPGPTNSPTMPAQGNGFAPDEIISEHEPDAQSEQTQQPEIDLDIGAPPVVATTEEPPTTVASDPVPGPADPGPSGAAEEPGYASLIEETHPRGYPSN